MTTLVISTLVNGAPQEVGRIIFDETNRATLQLSTTGTGAEKLTSAWNEVLKHESLPLKVNRRTERNGEKVTEFRSKRVKPTDDDYRWAVYDFLERKHGFQVDVIPQKAQTGP